MKPRRDAQSKLTTSVGRVTPCAPSSKLSTCGAHGVTRPTFELLRERRELAVVNPANGVRFTISLRDWQGAIWAVRVRPHGRREQWNPFTTAHRLMARERIADWLENLVLSRTVRCRTPRAFAT